MATNQEKLDAAVTAIGEDITAIAAEIETLKAQVAAGEPLDFSRVDELVARVDAVANPPAPEPTPEPSPDEPTV